MKVQPNPSSRRAKRRNPTSGNRLFVYLRPAVCSRRDLGVTWMSKTRLDSAGAFVWPERLRRSRLVTISRQVFTNALASPGRKTDPETCCMVPNPSSE